MLPIRHLTICLFASMAAAFPLPALAWGYEGHKVVAMIARAYLTPAALQRVDAILATDTDTLTKPDMASRATWADAWRSDNHSETASWHFVDVEIDNPDLKAACFGYPAAEMPASSGPAQDCVVDKVNEFVDELASQTTSPSERLLALKYVLHFVGDLHQPLHVSDNHDKGGNCVRVALGGQRTATLHAYWDTIVVEELGRDPQKLAILLAADISPTDKASWQTGDPGSWAMEAFQVGKAKAYGIGSLPGCHTNSESLTLPAGYDATARATAAVQLERAGVRLAFILNRMPD